VALRISRSVSPGHAAAPAASLLGPLAFAWRPGLRLLAEHTLQEYDALVAQVRTAPGISDGLAPRAEPLLESAREGYDALNSDRAS